MYRVDQRTASNCGDECKVGMSDDPFEHGTEFETTERPSYPQKNPPRQDLPKILPSCILP